MEYRTFTTFFFIKFDKIYFSKASKPFFLFFNLNQIFFSFIKLMLRFQKFVNQILLKHNFS